MVVCSRKLSSLTWIPYSRDNGKVHHNIINVSRLSSAPIVFLACVSSLVTIPMGMLLLHRVMLRLLRDILLQPICLQGIRLQEASPLRQFPLPIRLGQRLYLCLVSGFISSKCRRSCAYAPIPSCKPISCPWIPSRKRDDGSFLVESAYSV